MLRQITKILIIVSLALIGTWLAGAAYASITTHLNPDLTSGTPMEYIPVYPGAQGVQVSVYEDGWQEYGHPYKSVEYVTSATPAEVLDFYQRSMLERTTEKWFVEETRSTPDSLSMARNGTPEDAFYAQQYIFQVFIEREGQVNHVYVHRSWDHTSR